MLDLYESYDSQEERESEVMLESASIDLDRAILAYETATAMGKLQMREAECRLVMESGEVTDLADYYEEATADTEEKKKGLISRIWDKIVDMIEKIHNWVTEKLSKKVDPNTVVDVDAGFFARHQKLNKAVTAVKNFLAKPLGAAAAVLATAVLSIVGIKLVSGHNKKAKAGDVQQACTDMDNAQFSLKGMLLKMKTKVLGDGTEDAPGLIKTFINWIKETIQKGVDALIHAKQKRGDKKAAKIAKKTGVNFTLKDADDDTTEESAEENYFNFDDDDFEEDAYAEDAGDISDIAALLATL